MKYFTVVLGSGTHRYYASIPAVKVAPRKWNGLSVTLDLGNTSFGRQFAILRENLWHTSPGSRKAPTAVKKMCNEGSPMEQLSCKWRISEEKNESENDDNTSKGLRELGIQ